MFHYIVDKVKEKTQGWSKRFLCPGGREVLLKSTALAMPVYTMNIFKLSKGICEEIEGVLAIFWWSPREERKGLHWLTRNRLIIPKKEGGLGFRDIENFNLALLDKQVWRLLQKPECLLARVLPGKYYADTNIRNARVRKKSSFTWRSILHGRDLLKQGMRFVIGDGNMVDTWADPWLP